MPNSFFGRLSAQIFLDLDESAVETGTRRFRIQVMPVWRLRRCVHGLLDDPGSDWTRRAADSDFVDQSHLIREFRRLTGLAPREFARRLANVDHRRLWKAENVPFVQAKKGPVD
jgi:AraC-like DNA-binding protein